MLKISTQWNTYDGKSSITENFDDQPYFIKASWYAPFCNKEDIDRILNINNADDYLLRLAADDIADNPRQLRTFIYYKRQAGRSWSLSDYLHSECFNIYRSYLTDEQKIVTDNIACGFSFTRDPNGYAAIGPYGQMIILSSSIKYFSKFTCLAIGEYDVDVPIDVRMNAMVIAVRVLMQTESLDFELDPRGIIPEALETKICAPYLMQTVFLAGHEYSHFLLGHVKESSKTECSCLDIKFKDKEDPTKSYSYNVDQEQEFEADLEAMKIPMDDYEYSYYYNNVLMLFAGLTIYEAIKEYASPSIGYQDHPSAKARYMRVLENARKPIDFDEKLYCETLPERIDQISKALVEVYSINPDLFEVYGSLYLAPPNTEWRGKELIDREDY